MHLMKGRPRCADMQKMHFGCIVNTSSQTGEDSHMIDETVEPHKPQFASAPQQARKAATVEDAMGAAEELKPMVGAVRRVARERRAAISEKGKMALPPEQR